MSALALSFNKYLMSLVVVVNLVHDMKIRYNAVSGERLQKKDKDIMEKWMKIVEHILFRVRDILPL